MMKQFHLIVLLGVFAMSCTSTSEPTTDAVEVKVSEEVEYEVHESDPLPVEPEYDFPTEGYPGSWVWIFFDELTLAVERIDMGWDDYNYPDDSTVKSSGDLVNFEMYAGSWMYDKEIRIVDSSYEFIGMYQQCSNSISIDTERIVEVPMCVLGGLGSYETGWVLVEQETNEMRLHVAEESEGELIPFTLGEFKSAVENDCGENWLQDYESTTSLDNVDYTMFTLSYEFKIVFRNKVNGELLEKFFSFETPTSC